MEKLRAVISLKRKRHRPDQPQFLRPPKSGFGEHTLQYVLPPPQIHAISFAPPSAAAQTGTNLGVFVSYMAGHYPGILITGHIGNKHTQICTPSLGDDRALTLLKRGRANSVVGLELADSPQFGALPAAAEQFVY